MSLYRALLAICSMICLSVEASIAVMDTHPRTLRLGHLTPSHIVPSPPGIFPNLPDDCTVDQVIMVFISSRDARIFAESDDNMNSWADMARDIPQPPISSLYAP